MLVLRNELPKNGREGLFTSPKPYQGEQVKRIGGQIRSPTSRTRGCPTFIRKLLNVVREALNLLQPQGPRAEGHLFLQALAVLVLVPHTRHHQRQSLAGRNLLCSHIEEHLRKG